MSHETAPLPPPDREQSRKAIEALPVVGELGTLGMRAALAALSDIAGSNPALYEQIQRQVRATQDSFLAALAEHTDGSGTYVVSKNILHAAIAQGVISGATQTANAIGEATLHVRLLDEITGLWSPETEAGPETGPAPESIDE